MLAEDKLREYSGQDEKATRTIQLREWTFYSLYSSDDDNVWTPENLKTIKKFEDKILVEDKENW